MFVDFPRQLRYPFPNFWQIIKDSCNHFLQFYYLTPLKLKLHLNQSTCCCIYNMYNVHVCGDKTGLSLKMRHWKLNCRIKPRRKPSNIHTVFQQLSYHTTIDTLIYLYNIDICMMLELLHMQKKKIKKTDTVYISKYFRIILYILIHI